MYRLFIVSGFDKTELVVPDGFAPDFEYQNPATEYGVISAPSSVDIELSSELNSSTLGFAAHVETGDGDLLFDCEGYLDGILIMRGKLLVEETLLRSFQDTIKVSIIATDFPSLIQDLELPDVCSEVITMADESTDVLDGIAAINLLSYPDASCFFPTYKNADHKNSDVFSGIINPWSQTDQEFMDVANTLNSDNLYDNLYDYSPWMYIRWILDKISNATGYRFSGSCFEDESFNKIAVPSNYGLGIKKKRGLMIATATDAFQVIAGNFIDFDTEISDSESSCTPGTKPYTVTASGLHQVRVELNLANIQNGPMEFRFTTSGASFGLNWSVNQEYQVVVLEGTINIGAGLVGTDWGVYGVTSGTNLATVLENSRIEVFHLTNSSETIIEKTFDAELAVPSISIAQFLLSLRSWLNIRIKINPVTKDVFFDWCEDILAKQAIELNGTISRDIPIEHIRSRQVQWSLIGENVSYESSRYIGVIDRVEDSQEVEIGAVAFVRNQACFMEYNLDQESSQIKWKFLGIAYPNVFFGDGENYSINIGGKCIHMTEITLDDSKMIVPVLSGEAATQENQTKSNSTLMLCFIFGMQPGQSDDYPMASTSNLNMISEEITDFALYLSDGVWGVVDQKYDGWKKVIRSSKLLTKLFIPADSIDQYMDAPIRYENQLWIADSYSKVASYKSESFQIKLLRL